MLKNAATVLLLLVVTGCDNYVNRAEFQRVSNENAELRKQVEGLKAELAKKPEHHYSLHQVGVRTFRFDSSDGSTCVQLTSDADWKNPKTQSQSCDCQDLFKDGSVPNPTLYQLECGRQAPPAMKALK